MAHYASLCKIYLGVQERNCLFGAEIWISVQYDPIVSHLCISVGERNWSPLRYRVGVSHGALLDETLWEIAQDTLRTTATGWRRYGDYKLPSIESSNLSPTEESIADFPSLSSSDAQQQELAKQLRVDAIEQYLFVIEYMRQARLLWAPVII